VRFVSFSLGGGSPRPGVLVGDEVVDLAESTEPPLPSTMRELVALGRDGFEQARVATRGRGPRHPLHVVRRHASVPDPPAILAIGMNYRAHVAELGREPPEFQYC
jgi:2-keto-4-pentenoate hydratase/2-oxohepta-3-ene-1,7-dioic acid hydratase in catechol pathway